MKWLIRAGRVGSIELLGGSLKDSDRTWVDKSTVPSRGSEGLGCSGEGPNDGCVGYLQDAVEQAKDCALSVADVPTWDSRGDEYYGQDGNTPRRDPLTILQGGLKGEFDLPEGSLAVLKLRPTLLSLAGVFMAAKREVDVAPARRLSAYLRCVSRALQGGELFKGPAAGSPNCSGEDAEGRTLVVPPRNILAFCSPLGTKRDDNPLVLLEDGF